MLVHLLTSQAAQAFTGGCGYTAHAKQMPEEFSAWQSLITCPLCVARSILHKKVGTIEEMTLLIDLDAPEVRRFKFTGKPFRFRFLHPHIYVYLNEESPYCMLAIPCDDEYPDGVHAEAKLWILEHEHLHSQDRSWQKKGSAVRAAVQQLDDPSYTGIRCAICKKKDEGDFLPSPNNITEQVCMICLVKMSR